MNKLAPTQAVIYNLLLAKADAGEPCPRNKEICSAVGLSSGASVAQVLSRLEQMGLISIVRYQNEREITIIATGQFLQSKPTQVYAPRKPHISRGRVEIPKDLPESRYLVRDPCFKCGTRRDIGCAHYPLQGMAA